MNKIFNDILLHLKESCKYPCSDSFLGNTKKILEKRKAKINNSVFEAERLERNIEKLKQELLEEGGNVEEEEASLQKKIIKSMNDTLFIVYQIKNTKFGLNSLPTFLYLRDRLESEIEENKELLESFDSFQPNQQIFTPKGSKFRHTNFG